MKKQTVNVEINGKFHSAEVKDGEVISWQSLTLGDFDDMLGCMTFLVQIEYAMRQTKPGDGT